MPQIKVAVDDKVFQTDSDGGYEISVSESENNAISFTDDGLLTASGTGFTTGVTYPGNGIYGSENVETQTIQCDSSVSRIDLCRTSLDYQKHEGVLVDTLFSEMFEQAQSNYNKGVTNTPVDVSGYSENTADTSSETKEGDT